MKKTRIVILAIVIVAAICTAFYIVNNNSKKESAKEAGLTEIQKITTRNMEKDYPATPREVIKFYNRIVNVITADNILMMSLSSLLIRHFQCLMMIY